MSTDLTLVPGLLLTKDNPEVKRSFENNYVMAEFRKFRNLKVPESDIVKFFHKAQKTGADPVMDQIFLIPRTVKTGSNPDKYETVGTIVFHYSFIEGQAQKTGEYQGYVAETGPDDYFCPIKNETKKMLRSKVTVTRNGVAYSFTSWWDEYVQVGKYGVNAQWKGKPYFMLEKTALAGALRRAFPEWMSGVYISEELGAIEKDDDSIVTSFEIKEEHDKNEKIIDRIEQKAVNQENIEEITKQIIEIKGFLTVLTAGQEPQEKGAFMYNNLGIRSFKELDSWSLEMLKEKSDLLNSLNEKKKKEELKKKQDEKPSFVLEGQES